MENMEIVIPLWFYGFDAVMYFLSSAVAFLLSFYFYRIYHLSSNKQHQYLYTGFLVLALGFSVLSITSLYSFINFKSCTTICSLGLVDKAFSLEDFAYFMYFGFSLTAYSLIILAYNHELPRFSKMFLFLFLAYLIFISASLTLRRHYKVWYSFSEYFHLTSFVMMLFVAFRAFVNYANEKSGSSFLVMNSFIFIAAFHLFYLLSFINELYVFAHFTLLAGFFLLLFMVLTVRRK